MKYIKEYAMIQNPPKKYFVLNHNTQTLFVYKNCSINNQRVRMESLYFYQDDELIPYTKDEKAKMDFNLFELLKQILFESDKLDDVKKALPMLYNKLKYNI